MQILHYKFRSWIRQNLQNPSKIYYYPNMTLNVFFFHLCYCINILYIHIKTGCIFSGHKPAITKNGEFLPVMKRTHMNYLYLFQILGEVLVSHGWMSHSVYFGTFQNLPQLGWNKICHINLVRQSSVSVKMEINTVAYICICTHIHTYISIDTILVGCCQGACCKLTLAEWVGPMDQRPEGSTENIAETWGSGVTPI